MQRVWYSNSQQVEQKFSNKSALKIGQKILSRVSIIFLCIFLFALMAERGFFIYFFSTVDTFFLFQEKGHDSCDETQYYNAFDALPSIIIRKNQILLSGKGKVALKMFWNWADILWMENFT